ncbi:MAG: Gfo/Idh/MocA family oxidoreductase [Actinomycetota bacterium]
MKRVAVIGTGGMGTFHARALIDLPDVELAAVADPYPSDEIRSLGVPVHTDALACAAEGWDGVVIASPDDTHAELTLTALDAGSRVLCEKPLSHDLAGARDVVEREMADGVRRVQLGFMREYDPAHRAVADQLGDLGRLHLLRSTHRNVNAVARPPKVVIVQSMIHDIHTTHWLAGPVAEVQARGIERPGGMTHVLLVLGLASGASAVIEFSDEAWAYEVEVEITAAGGMVTTSAPQRPRLRVDGAHVTPIGLDWFGWFAEAYRIQDAAWVASLTEPSATGPSAWDSLAAQIVAEAADASLAKGGEVVPAFVGPVPELYRR